MKTNIKETIDVLKDRVRQNLLHIQNNQKEIRELLKQPVSDERSEKLEQRYALNKVLLAENNDFINVQLTLSNFLDKYNNSEVFETELVRKPCACVSEQDCFEKTVNGELAFDVQHPFYNDDTFFQKLMLHYQSNENYEACDKLMKEKK
jgi:hypothetical protein